MLKTLLAGVGLTSIALGAAVAIQAGYHSRGYSRPHALAVDYRAFDLSTPQGVRLLEQRIDEAVDRICGDDDGEAYAGGGDEDCRRDAWESTRPQIARAIAQARRDRGDWADDGPDQYGPRPQPAYAPPRWGPPPQEHADWSPPMTLRRTWTPPPPERRGGVLGGPIDDRIGRAFDTGESVSWRDHGWQGLVQVSEARRFGGSVCRTVSVIRPVHGAWELVREGGVCLRPDGALHNREIV